MLFTSELTTHFFFRSVLTRSISHAILWALKSVRVVKIFVLVTPKTSAIYFSKIKKKIHYIFVITAFLDP